MGREGESVLVVALALPVLRGLYTFRNGRQSKFKMSLSLSLYISVDLDGVQGFHLTNSSQLASF